MKKAKDEPQGVWNYQMVEAQPRGKKFKADKFCRSCGVDLPARSNPIGIQIFYCSQECAFDAAVHAAAKGYASHLYVKARSRSARLEIRSASTQDDAVRASPLLNRDGETDGQFR